MVQGVELRGKGFWAEGSRGLGVLGLELDRIQSLGLWSRNIGE